MNAPRFVRGDGLRLILFGGKGGVGKTSFAVATALAMAAREPKHKLLLVSTDPAHSLCDSLNETKPPPNLDVLELRAEDYLEQFRARHGQHLQEIASRGTFLDDEDIQRFLRLSLPGMDELFAFLEIARWTRERHDLERILIDTAPTGHTLRLLAMPELLTRFVDTLDTLLAKHRYMKQVFGRGYRPDALDAFLDELQGSVDALRSLLRDEAACQFVPVMLAEELSVRETTTLLGELSRSGIAAPEVVVNRLAPLSDCPICSDAYVRQREVLRRLPTPFASRTLFETPLLAREVRGGALLANLLTQLRPLGRHELPVKPAKPMPRPRVEHPLTLPPPSLALSIFAGKGGVGKTTLACASALRFAELWADKKTLLVSTDPAHSLADCLALPVGCDPTPIAAGLSALQIDAEAELAAVKRQYREELDELLRAVLGGLDLTFDRPVMERLFDLSPPGLDEMMAVTRAMELLSSHTYDMLVLDAAPTGHLIRLLEMPALIDHWLKAFFELFLKYKHVLHVPKVSERLVAMSKRLRVFRKLLRDPVQARLFAVSIPTEMARLETEDLLTACSRLELAAPAVLVNMVTPPTSCQFCRTRADLEQAVLRRYAETLPGRLVATVPWQPEPRGVVALRALGRELYREEG